MTTARDIISGALRLISEGGRGLPDDDQNLDEGLKALNLYIQSLSAEQIMVPYRTQESFTMTVGKDNYTYGSGGDLNSARPVNIDAARLTFDTNDYQLKPMNMREYQRIADKTVDGRPERYYYEPDYSLGRLYFDFEPERAYTLTITAIKPISTLTNLSTTISLPDEYLHFLKFNLASILAPEYGKEASAFVVAEAMRSKKVITSLNMNFRVPVAVVDSSFRYNNSFNINTD